MKTQFVFALILLLVFSAVFSGAIKTANISRIKNSTRDSCDIPTWYIGDEWTYDADPVTYNSDNGSFNGKIENLKREVIDVTEITHGDEQIKVYEVDITGDIQGTMSWGVISGDLDGIVQGTSYIRVSDLAEVKTEIFSTGTVKVLIITWPYQLNNINLFYPPLEANDFPLKVDDQWEISSTIQTSGSFEIIGLMEEEFSDTELYEETMKCTKKETISVPAGNFECYKITISSDVIWYSPDVGNILKSEVNHDDRDYSFNMDLSLNSFERVNQPIDISENIIPSEAVIGQEINISGIALDSNGDPIQNGEIKIEIPKTGDQWVTNTDDEGNYLKTIEAPFIYDDTPSEGELGSDGIIVSCSYENKEGYRIKTLLIIDYFPPYPPDITGPTKGKTGVEYDYNFVSTDPAAHDFYLYVDWGDENNSGWKGPYHSGEMITLSHAWSEKGTYTIRAKVREVIYGIESDWGHLDVNIPRSRICHNTFLLRFIEKFPNVFLVLGYIFRVLGCCSCNFHHAPTV
jgi:hypothetical protein